ncbi:MAG TPA: hypothetical protein VNH11_02120 [Pirellulales bacterium]|nr:hypothetical protein [Pirellulales bacterium]
MAIISWSLFLVRGGGEEHGEEASVIEQLFGNGGDGLFRHGLGKGVLRDDDRNNALMGEPLRMPHYFSNSI